MFELLIDEMQGKGFSDIGKLKKLNYSLKTWDGLKFDILESFNKEMFIEFLMVNSHKMVNLEEVDFWGFPADKLDKFLSDINSLKRIENTQGRYPFPKSILLNENLQYLSLTLTPIKKIPSEVGELRKLRTLIFSQTDIQILPEELGQLEELRELTIYTKLNKIHHSIASNKKLKTIDFGSNKITDLPVGIFTLQNLESINLSGNPIVQFDFQKAKWPKIKRLDLSRTPFGIYRNNIENLNRNFPNAEIIGGSNNLFVGDNKFGIYLSCTKSTYN